MGGFILPFIFVQSLDLYHHLHDKDFNATEIRPTTPSDIPSPKVMLGEYVPAETSRVTTEALGLSVSATTRSGAEATLS